MTWHKENWKKLLKFTVKLAVVAFIWKVFADMIDRGDVNFFAGIGVLVLVIITSIFLFGWRKKGNEEKIEEVVKNIGPEKTFNILQKILKRQSDVREVLNRIDKNN